MPEKKYNIFENIVCTFENFTDWLDNKGWWRAVRALIFLLILSGVSLLVYYGFLVIQKIDNNLTHGVKILEETHSSPDSLQEGLKTSVEDNIMIERELNKVMLSSTNGKAVIMFKFHDSKTDLQGRHDFFYSATNEVLRDNTVKSFVTDTQNITITRLGRYISPLIENRCITVNTVDMVENTWLRDRFIAQKIKTTSACPVYTSDNKYLVGFVEMVYIEPNGMVRKTDEVESDLKEAASRISIIITKKEDYK